MNDDKTTPTPPYRLRSGLSAIEYAALVTGQPCSGTHWLDVMLAKARRERLAGQALAGIISNPCFVELHEDYKGSSKAAVSFADAFIAALEGGAK